MIKLKYFIFGSIIIAIILFVSGSILGGFDQLEILYQRGEFNIEVPFIETIDIKKEYSDIENLKINCQIGTFDIVEYDGTVIKVEGNNVSSTIKIEKDNDTLVIKDGSQFNRLINLNDDNAVITVFVPFNYHFDKVKLKVDAGKMSVANISAHDLEVNVDLGSFEANNLIAENTDIDVDAGDIEIYYLDSLDSKFKCDLGNIDVTLAGSESDYDYKTDCDLGDIAISNYSSDNLKDSNQHGKRSFTADCDAGKITIYMGV